MIKMRLWHYAPIPVLDNKHLVSQWREVIAIKRQWEKGTLKHRLVSYVQWHDYCYFYTYVMQIVKELKERKINFRNKYAQEIFEFCNHEAITEPYPEHNDRYLKQCLYNLQEKWDRGIISDTEWHKIYDKFKDKM